MYKIGFTILVLFAFSEHHVLGQVEVYVDPLTGSDNNSGTENAPFATLQQAVKVTNGSKSSGSKVIKLFPGLYVLEDIVAIDSKMALKNKERYVIEAMIMPDDKNWSADKMPVILSTSLNNSTAQFPHSTGLLVAENNVIIKGLKFLGNSNPKVFYYYPVSKEDSTISGMEVSQCYFIAEKNTSPIQGAIWAHGPETNINHCIFYNCRNAILLFDAVEGFSVTNSIIYGAYESAVWMGRLDSDFVFKNNVITKCNYFWVRPENLQPHYQFSDCLITDNLHYTGFYTNQGLIETTGNENFTEINIIKAGKVSLIEKESKALPVNHLHLSQESKGHSLKAGIFKRPQKIK